MAKLIRTTIFLLVAGLGLASSSSSSSRRTRTRTRTRTTITTKALPDDTRAQRQRAAPSNDDDWKGYVNTTADLDWGLRFQKFQLLDDTITDDDDDAPLIVAAKKDAQQIILPLWNATTNVPLSEHQTVWLQQHTTAVSVTTFPRIDGGDADDHSNLHAEALLKKSEIILNHPSKDPWNPFWDDLQEVIQAQIARQRGAPAKDWLSLPKGWEEYSLHEVAKAVHDEFPGSLHVPLLQELLGGSADRSYGGGGAGEQCIEDHSSSCSSKMDRSIIPMESATEFLRGIVLLADMNTWAMRVIGPYNFAVKWRYGRARPEEVVWAILQKKESFVEGVPRNIQTLLDTHFGNLTRPAEFTAYPEGSPSHPSFPAMHAASSAASLWLAVVMDLTPSQHCRTKQLDYAIAYARTIAGVHYPTDNLAGLQMGQEILAHFLPDYLAETYGSDPKRVRHKIDSVRFDWKDYLTGECFP